MTFQGEAQGEIFPDQLLEPLIIAAVVIKDIVKPGLQADNLFMLHPFVSIVDEIAGGEVALVVAPGIMAVEKDMLVDDAGDLRVALIGADLRPGGGVIAAPVQTRCFGDIMEESAGDHQLPARRMLGGELMGDEAIDDYFRHPRHDDGMIPDVWQHPVLFHKEVAFIDAGDPHDHVYLPLKR